MSHDWVFDVLTDLLGYSRKNGLSALALQIEDALQVARAEIAAEPDAAEAGASGSGPAGGFSASRCRH